MKILIALLSYLIGALPSGYLFYLFSEKSDIRSHGSRSTGATNVLRLKGWKYAFPVVLIDIAKGFLPAFIALKLYHEYPFAVLCGVLAVFGHCFPVYIKFKGGKGVATTIGAFAALSPISLLPALAVFVITVAFSRFVSLGSLLAALCLAPAAMVMKEPKAVITGGVILFFIIFIRHSDNFKRILSGKENRFGRRES